MIIHVLDKSDKVVGVLSNEAPFSCPFFDDLHIENIRMGTHSYDFSVPANHEMASRIEVEGSVIFPNIDGQMQMFTIKNIEEESNDSTVIKHIQTEHVAITDLLTNEIVRPFTLTNTSLVDIINRLLNNTGYTVGDIEDVSISDITSEDYKTVLQSLYEVAELYQVEMQFEVIFKNGVIVDRLIHMKKKLGTVTNKLFTYSKDIQEVMRTENSEALVTALIGVGKGDDKGNRITLENYNPEELPDGFFKKLEDDFIYSKSALQAFGKNGKHRYGIYISDDATTQKELSEEVIKELKARHVPYITYEMKVVTLERITGYESEKVRVGDTINAKDTSLSPTLMIEARVLEVKRSYTNPEDDEIVLGDYRPIKINAYDDINKIRDAILANEEKWSNSGVTIPEVEEVVDGKVKPIERDLSDVQEEVKAKEYAIIRQDETPTGDFIKGQLWIDGDDYIYHWTGSDWKKLISVSMADIGGIDLDKLEEEVARIENDYSKLIQDASDEYSGKIDNLNKDIASKVDAEYVDGKLVSKADSDNVYTIKQVDDKVDNLVSVTDYTVDKDGIITDLESQESRITQNEKGLKSTVSETEYNQTVGDIKKDVDGKASNKDVTDLNTKVDTNIKTINTNISENKTAIEQTNKAISLKADSSDVYTKKQVDSSLGNKADNSTVTGLEKKVTDNTAELKVQSDEISTKVASKEFTEKISQVEKDVKNKADSKDVNNLENSVNNKLEKKADTNTVTQIESRLKTAETSITETDKAISLKADSSDVYTKKQTDGVVSDYVDSMEIGGRNLLVDSHFDTGSHNGWVAMYGEGNVEESIFTNTLTEAASASRIEKSVHLKKGVYTVTLYARIKKGYEFRNFTNVIRHIPNPVGGSDVFEEHCTSFEVEKDGYVIMRMYMNQPAVGDVFEVDWVKLEKGNKPTDWTPAPEDIDKSLENIETKVSENSAELSVHADKIESKVSSTSYNKKVKEIEGSVDKKANSGDVYTKGETNSRLNNKADNSKVNSIETRVKDAESSIEQTDKAIKLKAESKDVYTKTQADNIVKSDVNKAKADIKITTDSITQEVNKVSKKADGNTSKISENSANIKVLDKSIESKVSSTEMEKAIDDIDVGGRNLLLGNNSKKLSIKSGTRYIRVDLSRPIRQGERYTVSIKNRTWHTKVKDHDSVYFATRNVSSSSGAGDGVGGGGTVKIGGSTTKTNTSNSRDINAILFYSSDRNEVSGNVEDYIEIKLEIGNKATDWSPAPEDVEKDIKDIDTKITKAESRITQTEKDIKLRVTETKYNADIKGLNTKMSSALSEIEINSDSISSKVSTTDFTGQKVASLINQTANKVKIKADKIDLVGSVRVLSDITGNLGTITAGTINGAVLNGAEINTTGDFGNVSLADSQIKGSLKGYRMSLRPQRFNLERADGYDNYSTLGAGSLTISDGSIYSRIGDGIYTSGNNESKTSTIFGGGEAVRLQPKDDNHSFISFFNKDGRRTGYFGVSSQTHRNNLRMTAERGIAWVRASEVVRLDNSGGGADFYVGKDSSGPQVWSPSIRSRTYTGSANMRVTSYGTLGRATSARKYKLLEKPIKEIDAYKLLDICPKTWYDKNTVESYSAKLTNDYVADDVQEIVDDIPYIERVPGVVAEDVEGVGLSQYVEYSEPDEEGNREVEGVMYDRLWTLLIPIVKDHNQELSELSETIEELKDTINQLKGDIIDG